MGLPPTPMAILSFGGVRGYQNNFLVDGTDNNNSFFAQARGRYRAPYQFSNEVIKEFRVSSNSYSAELGRAGGGVFNVVTKSGSNDWHGTGFYYVRDRMFDAQPAFSPDKPESRQDQFGGTVSGPIRKNRAFFYAGFDENLLDVPSIVQFANGATTVVPQPVDYDYKDQALVAAGGAKAQQHGGRVSDEDVGQCRLRQARLHSVIEATDLPAGQHLPLRRNQQRLLQSLQSADHLHRKRERQRGRRHREHRRLADFILDQQLCHPPAGAVLARPATVIRRTPKIPRSRSTTCSMAPGAPTCCRARRANTSSTSPTPPISKTAG